MSINVPSPATTAPAGATAKPRAGWRQLPRDLVYLLLGFPIGLAAFVAAVVGLSVGAGTLIIWIGIPILVATLGIARGFAEVERVRIKACDGRPLPSTFYRTGSGNLLRRLLAVLGDPQYWRDIAHALVSFPVRIFTWVVAITWVAAAGGGITYIAWGWAVERQPENESVWDLLGIESTVAGVLLYVATGVIFLLTMPHVARGAAIVDVTLGRGCS